MSITGSLSGPPPVSRNAISTPSLSKCIIALAANFEPEMLSPTIIAAPTVWCVKSHTAEGNPHGRSIDPAFRKRPRRRAHLRGRQGVQLHGRPRPLRSSSYLFGYGSGQPDSVSLLFDTLYLRSASQTR